MDGRLVMKKSAILFSGMVMLLIMSVIACEDDKTIYDKDSDDVSGDSFLSTDSDTDDILERSEYQGLGSEACQDWQYATCWHRADQCTDVSPRIFYGCLEKYSFYECIDDSLASECAQKISEQKCMDETVPEGCSGAEIVDPAPAIEKCESWLKKLCAYIVGCSEGTVDECVESFGVSYADCSAVIVVTSHYKNCLKDIDNLECGAGFPLTCEYESIFMFND